MKYLLIALLILLSGCRGKDVSEENRSYPAERSAASERDSASEQSPDTEEPPQAVNTPSAPEVQSTPPPLPEYETIAESYTPLLDKTPERLSNINIACGAINGIALYPGGSFSFNEVVGRRTEERGFAEAAVIVDGHTDKGCGGGICQVSSTLYMSALKAGLQIDERHPHSHAVPYAPDGDDATVVYGRLDLRFTNNTNNVLLLSVWAGEEGVFSSIIKKNA